MAPSPECGYAEMAMFMTSLSTPLRQAAMALGLALSAMVLPGCTVLAVVDTAASVAIGTAGLAADAAIGTVRITGKAVGAAADAVLPAGK